MRTRNRSDQQISADIKRVNDRLRAANFALREKVAQLEERLARLEAMHSITASAA